MDEVWKGVTGVLGIVAPTIATALGGPLAGMAATALTSALGGGTPDEIAKKIQEGDPTSLKAVQSAEKQFQITLKELDIKLELAELSAKDTIDARAREIALRDGMPKLLACALIGLFAAEQIAVMAGFMPQDETAKTVVIKGMSLIETGFGLVFGYFLGSSSQTVKDNWIRNWKGTVKEG